MASSSKVQAQKPDDTYTLHSFDDFIISSTASPTLAEWYITSTWKPHPSIQWYSNLGDYSKVKDAVQVAIYKLGIDWVILTIHGKDWRSVLLVKMAAQ